jgi:hypothetical protein
MVGWGRAARSLRERLPEVFLLAQGAVAATIAWVIADRFAGHEDPLLRADRRGDCFELRSR